MAEIRWTEEAVKWVEHIYAYIAEDNPYAAQSVIEGIYAKAQVLQTWPHIGYKYKDHPEGEIRIRLYGHYRIAYLNKDDTIEILGVFHGAMEIEDYLTMQH